MSFSRKSIFKHILSDSHAWFLLIIFGFKKEYFLVCNELYDGVTFFIKIEIPINTCD